MMLLKKQGGVSSALFLSVQSNLSPAFSARLFSYDLPFIGT